MNILCRPARLACLALSGALISTVLSAPMAHGREASRPAGVPMGSKTRQSGTSSSFAIPRDMYHDTGTARHTTRLSDEERRVLRRQVNDAARNIYSRPQ